MQPCKHPDHLEAHVEHHRDEDILELLGRQKMCGFRTHDSQRDAAPGQRDPLKPVQVPRRVGRKPLNPQPVDQEGERSADGREDHQGSGGSHGLVHLEFQKIDHNRDHQHTAADADDAGDNTQGDTPENKCGYTIRWFLGNLWRLGREHPECAKDYGNPECYRQDFPWQVRCNEGPEKRPNRAGNAKGHPCLPQDCPFSVMRHGTAKGHGYPLHRNGSILTNLDKTE